LTSRNCAGGSELGTSILSSTAATPATLPAASRIFSFVAWSGQVPLTLHVALAPSKATVIPVVGRPSFAM
jgi:hypothetical protein